MQAELETHGYSITAPLLDGTECTRLAAMMDIDESAAGARNLLALPWCRTLAEALRKHPALAPCLPADYVACQCTAFRKSRTQNWLVTPHQDLSIAVAEHLPHPALSGWSEKEGVLHVQPTPQLLEQLLAVRLHLDTCELEDGPLKVVPGSHRAGRLDQAAAQALRQRAGEVVCCVQRGAAMLMRPLLLHASSRASGTSLRRVLHFVFGPASLPYGLRWHFSC